MLEFIVPIYNPDNTVDEIVRQLLKQENQDFSISFYIDKPTDEHLQSINQTINLLGKDRIKLIINSKHQPLNKVIYEALLKTNKDYVFVLCSGVEIDEDFTKTVLKIISKNTPDIIEVKAIYRGLVKYDSPNKPFSNKLFDLTISPLPLTYTSPVLFNKIFKKEVLLNTYNDWKTLKSSNKQYSVDIILKAFHEAKTYYYTNNIETRDWNYQLSNLNIKTFINEWKTIKKIFEDKDSDTQDALKVAQLIHYQIFLAGYIGFIKKWKMFIVLGKQLKTQNIKELLTKELKNLYETNTDIQKNKYFVQYAHNLYLDPKLADEQYWSDIFHKVW
ncbi:glycosyltransferase family 2 protein [[Mycoplasma] gypis]|uniref:Glycosyltransferase n=1 Tax=[Mycoplasma] gypis TaxID=92404 RepID=A0ABZ2RN00_9BACT|nr:glycosyltransferase [[Mycoplasma] gypis]MBN0919495.1 glycosyltransferase [[Mycoplasma] gypis]